MNARRLYLDNAATSFPKPPGVTQAMVDYATRIGASAGRGAYAEAVESGAVLSRCREAIRRLINGRSADHVVFTLNCSDALNLAIKGLIEPAVAGDADRPHVVCTATDHNSILRPLTAMRERGWIDVTCVPIDPATGLVDPEDVRRACRRSTRMICVTHASNVTGAVQPIRAIGEIARERAVPLVVDAAQSIGHVPTDVEADHIDLLAAPGHKALMGPLGTGFLYLRPGMERWVRTLREGGTGSRSDEDRQPETMPDKYEPGSHNTIGLAGLLAGVEWLTGQTVEALARHERALCQTFIDGVGDIAGLEYLGPQGVRDRIGVFCVRIDGIAPGDLARQLETEFGILTRAGIHCAPKVHETLGTTAGGGATRLSFGPFVSVQDVKFATDALAAIAGNVGVEQMKTASR